MDQPFVKAIAMRLAIICLLPLALGGCVSDEAYNTFRAQQAACEKPGVSHLSIARCQNAVMWAAPHLDRDRDLVELMATTREAVAMKVDDRSLSEADGKMQVAQAKFQLEGEVDRRNQAAVQAFANTAQAVGAALASSRPQPATVVVANPAPRPINCTSYRMGANVTTNCY